MVLPKWVKSLVQSIAVNDVIEYLVNCALLNETTGKIFEIGDNEKMTYGELMCVHSAFLNKNLVVLTIPFLATRLSSYWVDLVTPVKTSLVRPLIESEYAPLSLIL